MPCKSQVASKGIAMCGERDSDMHMGCVLRVLEELEGRVEKTGKVLIARGRF